MNSTGSGGQDHPFSLANRFQGFRLPRGSVFGIIILGALLAFEIFNYSTTEFALGDLLGDLRFAGVRWATILSLAFCGIDFAGIARLFTPEQGATEPNEVWYLFGAWLLAATMNAILTWWGVSMAILNHPMESSAVIDPGMLMKIVPVFVAVMVWLIRILIIGSLSYAGDRLFPRTPARMRNSVSTTQQHNPLGRAARVGAQAQAAPSPAQPTNTPPAPSYPVHPAPKPVMRPETVFPTRPEPTYQNLSMRPRNGTSAVRPSEISASSDTRR
ncbi:MAG TPA: hypothetical protein VMT46_09195 [Anaerolineaceae bacterium]|nr:hypothetical protein [Anaerolineaceae bacterium]